MVICGHKIIFVYCNGIANACTYINNELYRVRVEALVFKGNKIFVNQKDKVTQYGTKYKIPGGSVEPDITPTESCVREINEEMLVTVSNIKDTGLSYSVSFNGIYPYWTTKLNMSAKFEGVITFVYVASYEGKYTGEVADYAADNLKFGKWVDPLHLKLRPEHIDAVKYANDHLHKNTFSNIDIDVNYPEVLNGIFNTFDYGMVVNGKAIREPKRFDGYTTLNKEDFYKFRIGTCWDTTNHAFVYMKEHLQHRCHDLTAFYVEHGNCETHTWVSYVDDEGKTCIFESSWYGHTGIHVCVSKMQMITSYVKQLLKEANENYCVIEFTPPTVYNQTPEEYMQYIHNSGKLIIDHNYLKRDD